MRPAPYAQAGGWRPGMPPQQGMGMAGGGHYRPPHGVAGSPMPGHGAYGGCCGGFPPAPPAPAKQSRGPPRREMDSLLEELKAKQRLQEEKRQELKAQGDAGGQDAGGGLGAGGGAGGGPAHGFGGPPVVGRSPPGSSSLPVARPVASEPQALFLRELPDSVTEDVLCALFSRYGVVTSVDVVRPTGPEEKTSGYVTLDSRDSAQRAKDALQDREVDGVPLWIEWAKGPPPQLEYTPEDRDGCRHVVVEPPIDKLKRRIIDRLAKYVAQEGHPFEQIVMERESPEGMFNFLFQHDSPANIYYRWRTFAFAQGDNFKLWRTETFRICDEGAWWRPPPCEAAAEKRLRSTNFSSGPVQRQQAAAAAAAASQASASQAVPVGGAAAPAGAASPPAKPATRSTSSALASLSKEELEDELERQRLEERATLERQRRDRDKRGIAGGKRLTDTDWDRLEQLLRNVSRQRSTILETMAFCLDKSDWAIEITECITESLTIMETDMALKTARLLVVSDILHNTASSRPAAWAYRREFERSLPDIFEHLHLAIAREESRIQADQARQVAGRILRIWEDWGLFAPQFIRGLEAALMVGVKRLRSLAARGDASREPPWLEPKLADWRRQHFSQLEKTCRTRGLRSSTSHLEGNKAVTLEEARKEWLIDRLAAYELHAHEKEQARQSSSGSGGALMGRAARHSSDDLDGEAVECDIDGFPLDETELDGEPMTFDVDLMTIIEWARFTPDSADGRYLGDGPVGGLRAGVGGAFSVLGEAPLLQEQKAATPDEVVGVVLPSAETPVGGQSVAQDADPAPAEGKAPAEDDDESDEVVDVQRPAQEAPPAAEGAPGLGVDRCSMRNIELEVMELRASLATQGLHRDAIDDICSEKREQMILEEREEANAAANPPTAAEEAPRKRSQEGGKEKSGDAAPAEGGKDKEKEKERRKAEEAKDERRARESRGKQDKAKEDKERPKAERKEERPKEKAREGKDKDAGRPKDRGSSGARAREKAKAASPSRDRKDRDRVKKKQKSRSRSRERGSKKARR